ncbi:MAG: hypothetical protein AAGB02_04525 [Pseudomonadota bacterium]
MLLRRITEHVKAQNWTAVALDFVIVVVGVFIGIQVANWNDSRNDLRLEQDYLDRLAVDMALTLSKFSETADLYRQRKATSTQLISAATTSSTSGDNLVAAARSFFTSGWTTPQFNPVDATFQDLSSTGNLQLIRDTALRDAIISLYAQYGEIAASFAINEAWVLPNDARLVYEHDVLRWAARYDKDAFADLSTDDEIALLQTQRDEIGRVAATYYWSYDIGIAKLSEAIAETQTVLDQVNRSRGFNEAQQ